MKGGLTLESSHPMLHSRVQLPHCSTPECRHPHVSCLKGGFTLECGQSSCFTLECSTLMFYSRVSPILMFHSRIWPTPYFKTPNYCQLLKYKLSPGPPLLKCRCPHFTAKCVTLFARNNQHMTQNVTNHFEAAFILQNVASSTPLKGNLMAALQKVTTPSRAFTTTYIKGHAMVKRGSICFLDSKAFSILRSSSQMRTRAERVEVLL